MSLERFTHEKRMDGSGYLIPALDGEYVLYDSAKEAIGEERDSDECVCGLEHRGSRMAGTDAPMEPGRPEGPGCRPLTWKEVAERNARAAGERRKEGREAHLRAEFLADLIASTKQELERRERVEASARDEYAKEEDGRFAECAAARCFAYESAAQLLSQPSSSNPEKKNSTTTNGWEHIDYREGCTPQ